MADLALIQIKLNIASQRRTIQNSKHCSNFENSRIGKVTYPETSEKKSLGTAARYLHTSGKLTARNMGSFGP